LQGPLKFKKDDVASDASKDGSVAIVVGFFACGRREGGEQGGRDFDVDAHGSKRDEGREKRKVEE